MKDATIFYVVRHGQTEANLEGVMQGGGYDTPLTDLGIQQAEEIKERFKEIHFDAVFSSNLFRAQKTAEIIARERKLAVATQEILREKAFGHIEGKKFKDLQKEIRDGFNEYNVMEKDKWLTHRVINSMESAEEVIGRFIIFIREVAVAYPSKTILVVSHGSVMRSFLVHLGFAIPAEIPSFSVENAGYFVMESDGIEFRLIETFGINKKSV